MKKLAAVHCWTTKWWAFDVFLDLVSQKTKSESFDEIKIFTTYNGVWDITINWKKTEVQTAVPRRLNNIFNKYSNKKTPILSRIFDYRNLMFFYKTLMKRLSKKIEKYQATELLISSFAVAKNLEQCKNIDKSKYKKIPTTIYFHSPMQYIRSHKKEYLQKLKWFKWWLFRQLIPSLQSRDLQYRQYNEIYCNSKYTQSLIKKVYKLNSQVQYPKINQIFFDEKINKRPKEYFVCVGRVVKFVREVDIIINVFNKLKYPLIIIWSWPDQKELEKIAGKNISFLWRQSPKETAKVLKQAKWMINLTKESLGLSTIESLCLWVPVLWYGKWGSKELINKKTWMLIANKTEDEIIKNFYKFTETQRDREEISKQTRKNFIVYKK